MAEERHEVWQSAPTPPSNQPTTQVVQPQQGGGGWIGFVLGVIVGAVLVLLVTWMMWKVPLDNANAQLAQQSRMLENVTQREQKLRQALNTIRDALNAATSALETGRTTGTPTSPASSSTPQPRTP